VPEASQLRGDDAVAECSSKLGDRGRDAGGVAYVCLIQNVALRQESCIRRGSLPFSKLVSSLPMLIDEFVVVRQARRLRGYRFRFVGPRGDPLRPYREEIGTLLPVIATLSGWPATVVKVAVPLPAVICAFNWVKSIVPGTTW